MPDEIVLEDVKPKELAEEIKKTLRILKEGESEETEEDNEEQQTLSIENDLTVKIEPLNVSEDMEHKLAVEISNNLEKQISINHFNLLVGQDGLIKTDMINKIHPRSSTMYSVKLNKLKKGEYTLSLVTHYSIEKEQKQLKETRTLYVEPKKEAKKKGSWDEFERMLK